jgi:hypothetical protein
MVLNAATISAATGVPAITQTLIDLGVNMDVTAQGAHDVRIRPAIFDAIEHLNRDSGPHGFPGTDFKKNFELIASQYKNILEKKFFWDWTQDADEYYEMMQDMGEGEEIGEPPDQSHDTTVLDYAREWGGGAFRYVQVYLARRFAQECRVPLMRGWQLDFIRVTQRPEGLEDAEA